MTTIEEQPRSMRCFLLRRALENGRSLLSKSNLLCNVVVFEFWIDLNKVENTMRLCYIFIRNKVKRKEMIAQFIVIHLEQLMF